jgi:hypothetical protein
VTLPRIGITMGDATGVGPEVVMKALAHAEVYAQCRPLVIGDRKQLKRANAALKLRLELHSIQAPNEARFKHGTVDCIELSRLPADIPFGRTSAAAGEAPSSVQRIAIAQSATLSALVRHMNQVSDNFYAEMLLKGLGARFAGGGTTAAGSSVVRGFLRAHGVSSKAVDGSGLSRANAISPRAVGRLLRHLRVAPADCLILCDDVNLPLGRLRLRADGSAGGHHGLESVIEALGTEEFPRLRLGIGLQEMPQELTDFVLGRFTPEEQPRVREAIARAVAVCETWTVRGIAAAMNLSNRGEHDASV